MTFTEAKLFHYLCFSHFVFIYIFLKKTTNFLKVSFTFHKLIIRVHLFVGLFNCAIHIFIIYIWL